MTEQEIWELRDRVEAFYEECCEFENKAYQLLKFVRKMELEFKESK